MFEGSKRRFGITSNISGLSHGIVVNNIALSDGNESAQARDSKGRVIDIAVYGENNSVSIDGLYVGQGVEAGTVIKIDNDNYLVTSTSQNESNTAFQTASVNARYFPGEEPGPGPGPGPEPPGPIIPNPSLTFKAVNGPAVIQLNQYGSPDVINLEYKINNSSWSTYNIEDVIQLNQNDIVSFSGTNDHFSKDFGNFYFFSMVGDVEASENIQSLMNFSDNVGECSYYNLFTGCSSLITPPILSATGLANRCYARIFEGCTSLSSAPQLPATTLAYGCYTQMFWGCSSLSTAPQLPAITLADGCYNSMFVECTSLTSAPDLPATTLANGCYNSMFDGCTSLTGAPQLPATTLANGCYQYMFRDCTSLSNITVHFTTWNNTNTEDWVYNVASNGTFYKPSALATEYGFSRIPVGWNVVDEQYDPPEPQKTISIDYISDINWDFENASTSSMNFRSYITYTGDSTLNYYIVESLPAGVSFSNGILSANKNLMNSDVNTTLTLEAFASDVISTATRQFNFNVSNVVAPVPEYTNPLMFKGLSSTNAIQLYQEGSPNAIVLDYSKNGGAWTSYNIGDVIELDQNDTVAFSGANDHFSRGNDDLYHFAMTGTIEASGNIQSLMNFSNSCTDYCYNRLFVGCSRLVTAPQLPATELAYCCYWGLFWSCTSLTSAPQLPATELANNCYARMFQSCTSLLSAPELPATELASACYGAMFAYCTSLDLINVSFTSWNGNSTYQWVKGVASNGTFYKPAALSTAFGANYIPQNWNVIEEQVQEPDPQEPPPSEQL